MTQLPQPSQPHGAVRSSSGLPVPSGGMGGPGAIPVPTGLSAHSGLSAPSGMSGPSGLTRSPSDRDVYVADELAIVLSHYDVGTVDAIQEFPRGSRKSPKLILRTETGLYLLKRRARGKDDPFKVAFCHALQLYLASKKFPLPHLIGTRKDNNSMLQWKGNIYELFEYIKGTSYDNSLEATGDAGKSLAIFHKVLAEYEPEYEPPLGSYHAARSVAASFEAIPRTMSKVAPDTTRDQIDQINEVVGFMQTSYNEAAMRVNELGLSDWPMQIAHSDLHPGNMLFRGPRVVAVIDYDSARPQQRVLDIANGALQFSILGGGDDPAQWPDFIDESRFQTFLKAYDDVPGCTISRAELRTTAWLMIEALIAESVIPIAATGSFARMEGMGFLLMVQRKVRWLQQHCDQLAAVLGD